ncbi:MAG: hypothetical protein ACKVOT_02690 [Polaromonas sp.]
MSNKTRATAGNNMLLPSVVLGFVSRKWQKTSKEGGQGDRGNGVDFFDIGFVKNLNARLVDWLKKKKDKSCKHSTHFVCCVLATPNPRRHLA